MIEKLRALLELYHDYVNHCLFYDDSLEEIMNFGEWAELHHGVPSGEAEDFMYTEAA